MSGTSHPAVLVTDAHALGMIAVIRSLGRAGYAVHAVSARTDALGLHSRFARFSAVHPRYGDPAFFPWLDAYLAEQAIAAIVPSEGFLHAIAAHYQRYQELLPDAVAPGVWQRCMSKVETQVCLAARPELACHLPVGGIIYMQYPGDAAPPEPDAALLAGASGPFYLKADAGLGVGHSDALVQRCSDVASLRQAIATQGPRYRALLWQQAFSGRKVGVSLWRHQGEYRAESMVLGLHMQPHTGGMMSLRQTFWHEGMLADAKLKMSALGWQGVAMMEYVWNESTDEFAFVEINARYWGYLHLDLYAGKDFPTLQLDGFFGHPRRDCGPPHRALRCRHVVPGEIGYLQSRLKDPAVSLPGKLRSLLGFFLRFLHPFTRADLLFPGDRWLYFRAIADYLRQLGRKA